MRFATFLALSVGIAYSSISAAMATNEGDAAKAAQSWLALIDSGKYEKSWDAAAKLFQKSITRQNWAKQVGAVRTPLGKVLSRKLKSATYTKTLPGAPDGDYVVVQYETSFEKKADAVETITPSKESDDKWKVSGYFIK